MYRSKELVNQSARLTELKTSVIITDWDCVILPHPAGRMANSKDTEKQPLTLSQPGRRQAFFLRHIGTIARLCGLVVLAGEFHIVMVGLVKIRL